MSSGLAVDVRVALNTFRLDARFCAPSPGITALFGPSGAGKSLLLDVIAGVRRPDAGRIALNGRVLDDASTHVRVGAHERGIGLVFQNARLFPHLDVRGNLAFAASRAPAGAKGPSVEAAAAHFDIAGLLDRRVAKLSGGERARVALARAVLSAPAFLLLDEPFAALDGARRAAFIATLRRMHEAFAIPMLVVTHQIDDAAAFAGHIVGLAAGSVVADGALQDTVQELPFRNLLATRDVGAALSADALRMTAATESRAQWVRADHVLLAAVEPSGLSARNIWPGTVQALEREADGAVLVSVDTRAGALLARVTSAAASELKLAAGQNVWAIVKAHSL